MNAGSIVAYLAAENIGKSFCAPSGERREVLRNLTLQVEAGQAVAVTGASGAGKSTLLYVLAGLEKADAGVLRVGGQELAGARELAAWRAREVGFVFQAARLLPDLTAQENVGLPLLLRRGWGKRAAWRKAAETLAQVGLARDAAQPVGRLSGGEQQRVAVARALAGTPRLVLADEPTGNLDETTGREVMDLLLNYVTGQGAALVVATHNEAWARRCARWLVLRDGVLRQGQTNDERF